MDALQVTRKALQEIVQEMGLTFPEKVTIEPPRDAKHGGDLAANVAMMLAKEAKMAPRALAEQLAEKLQAKPFIAQVDVAGPGFLNVTLQPEFWQECLLYMEEKGSRYGADVLDEKKKTQVEFVSANPTGPLHIGHGRGAAVGDSVARILRFAGHEVATEYYINDAGNQMRLLGLSVWLRARELKNLPVEWPESYYKGEYIIDIAKEVLLQTPSTLPQELAEKLLANAAGLLEKDDAEAQDICYEYAMTSIMEGIKKDLVDFRVGHDVWFSEKSLVERGAIDAGFAALKEAGLSYEKDDALWFATEKLGDDKDRVLRKSDGSLTYFASDIAYHHHKFERGFDYLIDVWGADHHGYIPRMRAAITAIGREQKDFDVVLIQLVNLLENGTPVSMSTRAGTFETLADVVAEVGADAARFMFLSRKSDSPLDFDLELVKQRSMENPVYYVQYAHARICALLRRCEERGMTLGTKSAMADVAPLTHADDLTLIRAAARFPHVIKLAATHLGPHYVSHYLSELAASIHSYYGKHHILQEENTALALARLSLLRTCGAVLATGLDLLGVSAPDTM